MWKLRIDFPHKYFWVIPVPGEWHWTWHILQAIFIVYGEFIIFPLALKLGFKSIDLKAKNFHYAEDILEIATLALLKWVRKAMKNAQIFNPID